MFTEQDIEQIGAHGLCVADAERQMLRFREGFPYLDICRAAVAGDGILQADGAAAERYGAVYRELRPQRKVVKFVPASGAATRMFKALFEFLNDGVRSREVDELLAGLDRFAFAERLAEFTGGSRDPRTVVSNILTEGLGYGTLPKALILFHRYPDRNRTAFEEHLAEGALYAAGVGSEVCIHFTVSAEHREQFERLAAETVPFYEARFGVKYRIGYSCQKPSTDTLAVNPDDTPLRDGQGRLLFRPAGHGALIENLNEIDADLVFIKTVDNGAPDRLKSDTVIYKEMLAGLLLDLQRQAFGYLRRLDAGERVSAEEMASFVSGRLCRRLPASFAALEPQRQVGLLRELLDRPIRVCGMVKNEGEPGGGPFWVREADGGESLQIAESSQIAPQQKGLMTAATHFNPVDLVCGVRDYLGRKFDLTRYVDPQTGFISSKSQQGRPLKALELPGLWNGAMARWNTVFVEVPISTFSPVKVVGDLLRPQHRNG